MALLTGGTSSTTVLKSLLVSGSMGAGSTGAANVAAYNALIKDQTTANNLLKNTAFTLTGTLILPQSRGAIQCLPGDYIMVDPTSGWPIVVSAAAISGGSFVHS